MTRATAHRCHDDASIMSFAGKTRDDRGLNGVDYKARLEHKLYLARENPEPVFDISDCALKEVPSGTYTLCKVFRKRRLLMRRNKLTSLSGGGPLSDLSLLTLLDLSENRLTRVPAEIVCLLSLEELYLRDNALRELPARLGLLGNLRILDVADNRLETLPESTGTLAKLARLDVSGNPGMERLPASLGRARRLTRLDWSGTSLKYPPGEVLAGGAPAVVAFLADECNAEYEPADPSEWEERPRAIVDGPEDSDAQATLEKLDKTKESRQHALLEVEKNMRERQEYELGVRTVLEARRKKLLDDLAAQRTQLEREIEKVRRERDSDRARLVASIHNAEREADEVIRELLRSSEEERQCQTDLLEQEKREELEILSRCRSRRFELRARETLLAMEHLLDEELPTERKMDEYAKLRDRNARTSLELQVRRNRELADAAREEKKGQRENLLERLRRDEALQRTAVAALLERSDARSWSIVQQVTLVQSQLAALTGIELERKKLEINQQINDLADKRVTLSAILVRLLDQQEKRRMQLLERIQRIEDRRDVDSTRRSSLFWLTQYQSLMEARPEGRLPEALEPALVRHLAISGALHCLPFLVALPSLLRRLDDETLRSIGVRCERDRAAVKLAVDNYLAEEEEEEVRSSVGPSAPPREEPSAAREIAPPYFRSATTTECVVCLDSRCQVIFLPCGHACCCANCADKLASECPLCRAFVERKIRSA